jgi:ERCC4-type nuclease
MRILIDTREQRKLYFGCSWEIKTLKFGDYGCMFDDTYQYPVVFERKNQSDLYGSLTQGYDRLRKCFQRAEKAGFKMIIAIEGTREKILKGNDFLKRDPESIIKQLETIKAKYGVEHIFFGNRPAMANYICDFFLVEYEKYILEKTCENIAPK